MLTISIHLGVGRKGRNLSKFKEWDKGIREESKEQRGSRRNVKKSKGIVKSAKGVFINF
mgnify:FL=1